VPYCCKKLTFAISSSDEFLLLLARTMALSVLLVFQVTDDVMFCLKDMLAVSGGHVTTLTGAFDLCFLLVFSACSNHAVKTHHFMLAASDRRTM